MSTRFREIGGRLRKLGVIGGWLCCALLCLGLSPCAIAQTTVTYIHTDALGSVVAKSDANGNVIERITYEPYGAVVGAPVADGPGYTGHVSNSATGMSYMQQRYMDPQLGIFLSVDPVTAYDQPVGQFNRYRYANSNPYKFTDPDGRQSLPRSVYETDWTKPETRQAFGEAVSIVADFTPVVGDVKGVAEAVGEPTPRNILAATVGLIPIVGDVAGKAIKNADHLIDAAGKLERVKGGARQGRVEGDAGKLFDAITDGGTKTSGGRVRMPDGTVIGSHTSKTTGVATIDINKSGQIYKIRIDALK
ncbi:MULTISPECIES: RHS repeat-associated core domain-containing protein [Gammaproteobacteria]|uniref:RHS repeat-associated core domain-containing protein n=1 Tax=Stenotrophomonas bentonitica TaxID=1450134 RepID=A0ABU9JM97_9GAMM|nr:MULTISPECIES: RHS repeat-associated core domain-containing protein [Gammaproteobacteria]